MKIHMYNVTYCSFTSNWKILKYWKLPKCLNIGEWLKRLGYIHTIECYAVVKKERGRALCTEVKWFTGVIVKWKKQSAKRICSMVSFVQ